MQIKTFTAPNMVQLLDVVRASLGPQAVLLSVRRMTGTLGNRYLEASAAGQVKSHTHQNPKRKKQTNKRPKAGVLVDPYDLPKNISKGKTKSTISADDKPSSKNKTDEIKVPKKANKSAPKKQTPKPLSNPIIPNEIEDKVEINSLKNKVDPKISCPENKKISPPVSTKTRMIMFMGPHQSGKTLMAAKVAAHLKATQTQPVGLISLCNSNIKASNTLCDLAKSLSLPWASASSASELRTLLERWNGRGPIIFDLPGLASDQCNRLRSFQIMLKELGKTLETHLVLRADRSPESITSWLSCFVEDTHKNVALSNLDKAENATEIIANVMASSVTISYLNSGPHIQQDVECSNPARLFAFFEARLLTQAYQTQGRN